MNNPLVDATIVESEALVTSKKFAYWQKTAQLTHFFEILIFLSNSLIHLYPITNGHEIIHSFHVHLILIW